MNIRALYDRLHRDPDDFGLFERVWQVLAFAPSSKHAQEEELVSLVCDAFDYLQATGAWSKETTTGKTKLTWDGAQLKVTENDHREFEYQHTFTVRHASHSHTHQQSLTREPHQHPPVP